MSGSSSIQASLENYLSPILVEYQNRLPRYTQGKVLRDVIWGFNRYEPWEMTLIDSPPFQRLRNIFQTSLALYTYPCAVHSRFEHSLGVATVASRMLTAIRERCREIDRVCEIETRLAALLHDLGHGPFSHSSEKYYEHLSDEHGNPIFGAEGSAVKENLKILGDASASEVITYLLIKTKAFQGLWDQIVHTYSHDLPELDKVNLGRVASMIVGSDVEVGEHKRFYRQIVNGPFDADKLDYLPRDGYFTGLSIVVDIERLLNVVTVISDGKTRELGVVVSGASVLEQVIFGKTQIFASVYHHHKVRAAHGLLLQLLRTMRDRGYRPGGRDLGDPVSYTTLDDYDLLHSGTRDADVDALVRRIKSRNLPKRALVISYPCFDDDDKTSRENFNHLTDSDFASIQDEVEKSLHLPKGDVLFDLPEPPRIQGTGQALVQLAPNKTLPLQKMYPAGAWAAAYAGYRRIAYVFTSSKDAKAVGAMVRKILASGRNPVKLNEYSLILAKH